MRSCYAENGGFDWVKKGQGVLEGCSYNPDLMTQNEPEKVLSLRCFGHVAKLEASYFVVVVAALDIVVEPLDGGGFDWVKRGHEPPDLGV